MPLSSPFILIDSPLLIISMKVYSSESMPIYIRELGGFLSFLTIQLYAIDITFRHGFCYLRKLGFQLCSCNLLASIRSQNHGSLGFHLLRHHVCNRRALYLLVGLKEPRRLSLYGSLGAKCHLALYPKQKALRLRTLARFLKPRQPNGPSFVHGVRSSGVIMIKPTTLPLGWAASMAGVGPERDERCVRLSNSIS